MQREIQSVSLEELQAQLPAWNQPSYRASQIMDWIYRRHVTSWEEMSNVPRSLRRELASHYKFQALELVAKRGSADTTLKFLWKLADGSLIESVLIPANPALYGEPSDRHTLCVSTQVGCAYGCRFCASGLEGWKRNLTPGEIVEQILAVERWHDTEKLPALRHGRPRDETNRAAPAGDERLINNLVIMGMGEPLANYQNLLAALKILNAPWGGGIGARKITVSTSGLAPQIRQLADEPLQLRLAISLHGASDEVRNRIMPVNRKYPLSELLAAAEYYRAKNGRMITLEYILIAGVNDGLDQIKRLADFAKRLQAKVNLIPYNTVDGLPWERPSELVQEQFAARLKALKIPTTLRREKGHDINAACGQLRLQTEQSWRKTTPWQSFLGSAPKTAGGIARNS